MAIFGRLNGILGLETEAWTKGTRKAGDDIDGLNKKTQSFFDTAKGFRSSGFGQSLRLLAGGGALGIVDRLVGDATKMVDKFSEMSGKIDAGDASMGDLAGEVARTTPVLGTFVKFWDSVIGAATGTTKELAEQDAIVKAQLDALERRNAIIRDGTAAEKGFTEELRKWSQQHIVEGLGDGVAGGIGKAIVEQTNASKKVQDEYAAGMKKINEDIAKGQPDLEAVLKTNPDASLLPILEKRMEDLKKQEASAQKWAAAAAKPRTEHTLIGDVTFIDAGGLQKAQAAADAASRKIQDLQTVISAAKEQRDKLANGVASVLHNSLIDFASGVGKAITNPLEAAWKKTLEITGKVKAKLDEDAAENRKRLADLGKQLTEEALTPTQKFLEEMKQIDTLQKLGTITDATHDALQKKYMDQLGQTGPKVTEFQPVQAQANPFGFARVNNQLTVNGPIDKLATAIQKMLDDQRNNGIKLSPDTINALTSGNIQVSF